MCHFKQNGLYNTHTDKYYSDTMILIAVKLITHFLIEILHARRMFCLQMFDSA